MMSTTNLGVYNALTNEGLPCYDAVMALGTTQTTAFGIQQQWTRVIAGAASSGVVLPSVLSEVAQIVPYFVTNDGPNTILLYPAPGEKQNGTLNATLSIVAGATGVAIPMGNKIGTVDWRSASVT
jgi:hypothetical protein